ncbi:MAG: alpha/beta hydrolase [Patescibacteria group bacterium]|nr:alpha/beta hydrolase [Patescibacteria group bacterium]
MQTSHVSFSATDLVTLPGLLYTPDQPTSKVAVWLHGMGDSGVFYSPRRITALANSLTEQGIALLAFNNRGAHNSKLLYKDNPSLSRAEQRYQAGTHYELIADCVPDINGAIAYLKSSNFQTFYLVGHSTGANKICVYNRLEANNPFSKYVLAGPGDDVGLNYQALGSQKFKRALQYAAAAIDDDKPLKIMPLYTGLHPFSAQSAYDILNPDGLYNIFPYYEALHGQLGTKALFTELKSLTIPVQVIAGEYDEATTSAGGAAAALSLIEQQLAAGIKSRSQLIIIPDTDHSFHGAETLFADKVASWLSQ